MPSQAAHHSAHSSSSSMPLPPHPKNMFSLGSSLILTSPTPCKSQYRNSLWSSSETEERQHVKIPWTIQDTMDLQEVDMWIWNQSRQKRSLWVFPLAGITKIPAVMAAIKMRLKYYVPGLLSFKTFVCIIFVKQDKIKIKFQNWIILSWWMLLTPG